MAPLKSRVKLLILAAFLWLQPTHANGLGLSRGFWYFCGSAMDGFRKLGIVSVAFAFIYVLSCHTEMVHARRLDAESSSTLPEKNNFTSVRKLLQADGGDSNRIGVTCSKDDISVYQGDTGPLPNGIPTYTVQILNACVGCTMSDIHFSCGWFSSVRLINPRVFRRLGYNDCLVNDGAPLGPGGSLSFEYANSFQYPLSVTYMRCR
ncbi:TPD1 protein homolog 1-like [Aristolochia californica]|uniref:TPD1 protein homolog 1-like n=1 Tax=Aristolochia californica TaxID=171875 RepID=UPI0035D75A39